MTLIVGIRAQDGVVIGSDSQVTAGAVRYCDTKIFQLNDKAVWGASGELALVQRLVEKIDGLPQKDHPLAILRDLLTGFVKEAVESLLKLDFRTQFSAGNPESLLSLHPGDFLFAEYRPPSPPRILHIMSNGTPEWVGASFAATGNGAVFAHALLVKYSAGKIPCDKAKLLAYKVIEEAIEVGGYGLGPPIAIWEITAGGVKQSTAEDIAALEDAAHVLREQEVSLLLEPQSSSDLSQ